MADHAKAERMSRLSFHSSQSSAVPLTLLAGVMFVAGALTGCAEHGRMAIPAKADRIASGSGAKLTVVSVMRWGRLHVLDRDDDSILWAGDVHAGQTLVINGLAHRVLLDGRIVAEGIQPKHHYVVFLSDGFKPSP